MLVTSKIYKFPQYALQDKGSFNFTLWGSVPRNNPTVENVIAKF